MGFRIFSQVFEYRWVRAGLSSLLAIGAMGGITFMQWQRLQRDIAVALPAPVQEQQERLAVKSLKYLPTQGFGFNNLIADWTFLRFLQYAGDLEARAETGYSAASDHFDVITKRDPRFLEVYIFSTATLSYDLGRPEDSILLLDRGLAALDPQLHAGAHNLWTLRALDQLLLLGDGVGASQSYGMAAKWAAQSPDQSMHQDAAVLQRLSNFLQGDPDSARVRFWAWNTVYNQAQATNSAATQARARAELLQMGAQAVQNADGVTEFLPPAPSPAAKPPQAEKVPDAAAANEQNDQSQPSRSSQPQNPAPPVDNASPSSPPPASPEPATP